MYCTVAVATLYKWVDEQGRVHYSDKKPPAEPGNELKELEVEQRPPPDPEEQKRRQEQRENVEQFLKAREEEHRLERKAAEKRKAAKALRAKKCEESHRELRWMEQTIGSRLARPDAKGDVHWITDEERVARIMYWRAQVEEWCE